MKNIQMMKKSGPKETSSGRSRIVPFVEDEEYPDDEKIRTQRNKQWTFLDGFSATLRENLRKNKVFERCTEFAACLLNNTRPDALAEKKAWKPHLIFFLRGQM
jgi:hypothetical protein